MRTLARWLVAAGALVVAACSGDAIDWTDPMTLSSAAAGDATLTVDGSGRAHLLSDSSVSARPAADACPGTVRAARLDDGQLVAVWFVARPDSSVALRSSVSADGGRRWGVAVAVDTTDVGSEGCARMAPSIAASAGFVHVAYALRGREGAGVFYAHSMTQGRTYEAAVAMVYGGRLTRAAIAADRGVVAVAYEDPNDDSGQIGLALSREWGHIFGERVRVSSGVGGASEPLVAVRGREVAVAWRQGGGSTAGAAGGARVVRVGRIP